MRNDNKSPSHDLIGGYVALIRRYLPKDVPHVSAALSDLADAALQSSASSKPPPNNDSIMQMSHRLETLVGGINVLDPDKRRIAHEDIRDLTNTALRAST